ncbi:MAG: DMT family transporter [Saprospiraceae bacterium]|nr:DMT family transporter [Saprospiraceae bacterium]
MTTSDSTRGYLFILSGSILFSTKAVLVKLAFNHTTVDPVSLLALRMLFSLPFFLLTGWWARRSLTSLPLTRRQWWYVIGLGLLGYYLSSLLDFIGLKYISAGLERLILFLFPTFTVLINALFFKERFTSRQMLAIALSYLGILIAYTDEMSVDMDKPGFFLGSALILICSITYAGYIVGTGRLLKQIPVMRYTSLAMLSATAGVLIHFYIAGNFSVLHLNQTTIGFGLMLAIMATVIPNFLVAAGIKSIGSNNAAIVSAIGPVSTIILAYFFLGESMNRYQIIGTCFVIAGVIMIGWKGGMKSRKRDTDK